ncbi:MAG: cytochrome C oxidase subunit IV family protein [Solirubrobacterales bacterium]|nr:cytochrome C oxidase subunit IV family protein [Solirubrobacterales bacterium]
MTRTGLLRTPISLVWLGLIAATLLSWWLGSNHGVKSEQTAGALILLVAFAKVRYVGLFFMELRHAPLALRCIFEGWCALVSTTIIVMFLVV